MGSTWGWSLTEKTLARTSVNLQTASCCSSWLSDLRSKPAWYSARLTTKTCYYILALRKDIANKLQKMKQKWRKFRSPYWRSLPCATVPKKPRQFVNIRGRDKTPWRRLQKYDWSTTWRLTYEAGKEVIQGSSNWCLLNAISLESSS